MLFTSGSRFVAYSPTKEKVFYEKEFSTLTFENSVIPVLDKNSVRESFSIPVAVITQVVTHGFRFLHEQLERRVKRFVYEYHHRATNMQAGSYLLPVIHFTHYLFIGKSKQPGLRITFSPVVIRETNRFTYQLKALRLQYSKAKTSRHSEVFDYTLKLTLYFLIGDQIIERVLPALTVSSVSFGDNQFSDQQLYTSPIPLEDDAVLLEAALTVVESNPAVVNTANVLRLVEDHQETLAERITALLTRLLNKPE
ncbi:hypothetical protein CLV84_1425 [Neolewinella xylanilytica]|uniref:Uncharacterized protein n=1 Tax=Neolewinella xylanilytica TaxID=1514080 RepID=A0A2S6IAE6_9BACT|nr:hypothetical protein [Neolewinella xylanilytica]PPK88458.1 hypothetical protein CLV84_1425 [Neolewinella xylanilytica]